MKAKPLPTRHAGPGDSPGFLLWRISNVWQREQRSALLPLALTHTQFVHLAVATWYEADEPLTQTKLAQITGSDVMTTSQVVRALVTSGHLKQLPHPSDTRAKIIATTSQGRALAEKAEPIVETVDAKFFKPLGARQAALVKLFQALAERD